MCTYKLPSHTHLNKIKKRYCIKKPPKLKDIVMKCIDYIFVLFLIIRVIIKNIN